MFDENTVRKELSKYSPLILPILKASRHLGLKIYPVGGLVRDILIGVDTNDLDFVVEGDVRQLTMELLKLFRGRNYKHLKEFGTASFDLEHKCKEYRLDFARARKEWYPVPGEHPKVEFVDNVKDDLFRRDFTINAMAMEVSLDLDFHLIDVVGGLKDLMEKKIRVIHKMSIADDPTRILRAVRLALKLGFDLDSCVLESLDIAKRLGSFRRVHGSRFFSEIKIASREERFDDFMRKLKEMNVLVSIHPALDISLHNFPKDPTRRVLELLLRVAPASRYDVARFLGVSKSILRELESVSDL